MPILLLFISLLPVVVLLWYFERQDKGKKEPKKLKRKVFIWGVLSTIAAGFIGVNVDPLWKEITSNYLIYAFLTSFVTAALIEEALKLWVVKSFVWKNKHFDEVMDGITYAVIASLGFAAFENILYVLPGGIFIGITRAVISVPAHAMFSGVMGYYIGKARFQPYAHQRRNLIFKGYFFAVLYHGLFNFFLLSGTFLMILVIPLLLTMGFHLRSKIKRAHFEDKLVTAEPKKFTLKTVAKIFISSILIILGLLSIAGTVVVSQDSSYGYTNQDLLYSIGFAVVLFFFSFLILRKKKPSKERGNSSRLMDTSSELEE